MFDHVGQHVHAWWPELFKQGSLRLHCRHQGRHDVQHSKTEPPVRIGLGAPIPRLAAISQGGGQAAEARVESDEHRGRPTSHRFRKSIRETVPRHRATDRCD
jgi:hypothetical protein